MRKINKFLLGIMGGLALLAFAGCDDSQSHEINPTNTIDVITVDEALRELQSFVGSIDPHISEPVRGVDTEFRTEAEILPDIEITYPIVLEGTNQVTAEIFVSPEKSGNGMDGLFLTIAESFNAGNFEINGQTVSVSIRNMPSGTGLDYIVSGIHIPDGFTPSNDMWGQIMAANNVNFNTITYRTIGNTSGLLMRESVYNEMIANHGEITIQSLVNAVANDGILLGYTSPFTSSVGLDLLVSLMYHFDSSNPVSESAVSQLNAFQNNVPASFFNTLQLRDAARNGSIDVMSISYQTFVNTPEFNGFTFTPLGGRQDSPMYTFSDGIYAQIVELFTDYILNDENQVLATQYGFNELDNHTTDLTVDNRLLSSIQMSWRENRSGGRSTVAVFVADVSGSMRGEPIHSLRESLLNSVQYINDSTYVGLISYHSDVTIELPIARMDSTHRSYFIGTVQGLEPQGQTATFDATLVALQMLQDHIEENPDIRPIIFLLSDGETNRGNSLERIAPIVQALGVPIVTIGFNDEFPELEELSKINEGVSINANNDDLMYRLRNLFNAGM